MARILSGLRRILRLIGRIEMICAAAILCGIVAMIVIQVLLNAGLGNPITWEQEAGAYALVWLTFLGASIGLKHARHVTIVSFVGRLPTRLRYSVRAMVYLAVLWLLIVLMGELFPVMSIEARSTTIALPVDLPRSYFFSLPLMVSCALMLLTNVLFLMEALLGVFSASGGARANLLAPITESDR